MYPRGGGADISRAVYPPRVDGAGGGGGMTIGASDVPPAGADSVRFCTGVAARAIEPVLTCT